MIQETQTVPPVFNRERDTPKLQRLSEKGVWIGTSSWTYDGWRDSVYLGDYSGPRSPFVQKKFKEHSLEEYVQAFSYVCFDGSYYQFPTQKSLDTYASVIPNHFQFSFKVNQDITLPYHRTGPQRGTRNSDFLNPNAFIAKVLTPFADTFKNKLGIIIFEFSAFYFESRNCKYSAHNFVKDLEEFLQAIPHDGYKYAIEVRDPQLLDPSFMEYRDCLRKYSVAHILNEQERMPPIAEQMNMPGILTSDFTVIRAMTLRGESHDQAENKFAPFTTIKRLLPNMRKAISTVIKESLLQRRQVFVSVSNCTEGNAPNTIAGVLDLL